MEKTEKDRIKELEKEVEVVRKRITDNKMQLTKNHVDMTKKLNIVMIVLGAYLAFRLLQYVISIFTN